MEPNRLQMEPADLLLMHQMLAAVMDVLPGSRPQSGEQSSKLEEKNMKNNENTLKKHQKKNLTNS